MKDGEIVAAVCEERFRREKNFVGYPIHSIQYCLESAGISAIELATIVFTTIDNTGILIKSKTNTRFSIRDYHDYYGPKYYQKKFGGENALDYLQWLRDGNQFQSSDEILNYDYLTDDVLLNPELDQQLFRDECIRFTTETFGVSKEKIQFLDHHTCHAYYAYFASTFRDQDCAVITLDGWGDGRNQTVWKVHNEEFTLLADSGQNEIGRIYKIATLLLGMRPDEHEFKVMGMAPYAKDSYVQKAFEIIKDICEVDGLKIIHKDRPQDLYSYLKYEWESHRFDNIAGAVQQLTEQLACQLVRNVVKETGISRLVLGGGIAMNIKMNQAISDLPEVTEFFVAGSNGDESLSIGGCYLANAELKNNKPLHHMYLGYDVTSDIDNMKLSDLPQKFDVVENPSLTEVCKLLFSGKIVGRIDGPAEFGARALGNRSILANPSIPESVQKINEAIKNRDFWMPFALSVLEDKHHEYIDNPKNLLSPVMAMGFNSLPNNYSQIKAGTHPYDRTVRPQFVSPVHNPNYYALISEYAKISGVPALLNTSFNLHGEPIIDTVQDAIRTFDLSGLDHLLIGSRFLLSKR